MSSVSSEAEPSPTLDKAVDARVRIRGRDIADACVDGGALKRRRQRRRARPAGRFVELSERPTSERARRQSMARHAHAATTRKSECKSKRSTMTSLRSFARSRCCGKTAGSRSNSVQLSVQAKRREGEAWKDEARLMSAPTRPSRTTMLSMMDAVNVGQLSSPPSRSSMTTGREIIGRGRAVTVPRHAEHPARRTQCKAKGGKDQAASFFASTASARLSSLPCADQRRSTTR